MRRTATGRAAIIVVAITVTVCTVGTGLLLSRPSGVGHGPSRSPIAGNEAREADPSRAATARAGSTAPSSPPFTPLPPDEIALLPEARYDAVVPDLIDARHPTDAAMGTVYSLLTDAPLYGSERTTPVARLAAVNFLGEPTVVVPVDIAGDWARVLTPARRQLPSFADGAAAAQTSGWLRTELLVHPVHLPDRIVVSVGDGSLGILTDDVVVSEFDIGVGTPDTPTPVDVTGYLQARYLDPAQGQDEHRVQLTSLHSSVADEPYGGSDGGLIGIHYSADAAGTVSHGCIRLSASAIEAVDALPIGTTITVLA